MIFFFFGGAGGGGWGYGGQTALGSSLPKPTRG